MVVCLLVRYAFSCRDRYSHRIRACTVIHEFHTSIIKTTRNSPISCSIDEKIHKLMTDFEHSALVFIETCSMTHPHRYGSLVGQFFLYNQLCRKKEEMTEKHMNRRAFDKEHILNEWCISFPFHPIHVLDWRKASNKWVSRQTGRAMIFLSFIASEMNNHNGQNRW